MKYSEEEISKRLGLEMLDPEMAKTMLATFYDTLDVRMGMAIADKLNDGQLAKFQDLKESGEDDQSIEDWLTAAIPGYQTMLDEEVEKLLTEIDSNASDLLSYTE